MVWRYDNNGMNTVQIHNYMFWNYNEMEEGFVGDYEGDGDGMMEIDVLAFRITAVKMVAASYWFPLRIPFGG